MTVFVPHNHIVLLRNGTEYFPALEQAIEQADLEIYLQTYIFEADAIGHRIASALARAARRGVTVNLLLDGFGSKNLPRDFIRSMQADGIQVLFYRPKISPWTLKRNRLRRLHCKIAVIDGRIGFVGGINIIDDMNTPGHTPPRIDYAVQIQGPLLREMQRYVRRLWERLSWTHLRRVQPSRVRHAGSATPTNMEAAFVIRDNTKHRRSIEWAYLTAIEAAQQEIVIANAYFLPGRTFRKALISAARRGVRVILLLQAHTEYWWLDYASRALYDHLLAAGIEIYEYCTSFMHSKVAVIDQHWATVGSSNIDPFSLLLAREANIIVEDTNFATLLRQDIELSIRNNARRVPPHDRGHTNLAHRTATWLMYTLVRAMMGVIGFPNEV
ncbi:MAG: cardiolipin synthase ClsB [Methylophilaceae bacterium]|nr:cardiolipin synthase ClsB [Methylophilaceae bacterium]